MSAILELDREALEHGFIHLKRKDLYKPAQNDLEEERLAEEIGADTVYLSEDDHIYMFDVFLGNEPLDFLDYLIERADRVKGTYTVEDLGIYNASFAEILKAIKKFYNQKLTTTAQK